MSNLQDEDIEALLAAELATLDDSKNLPEAVPEDGATNDTTSELLAEGFLPELEAATSNEVNTTPDELNYVQKQNESEDLSSLEMSKSFADLKATIQEKSFTRDQVQYTNDSEASLLLQNAETDMDELKEYLANDAIFAYNSQLSLGSSLSSGMGSNFIGSHEERDTVQPLNSSLNMPLSSSQSRVRTRSTHVVAPYRISARKRRTFSSPSIISHFDPHKQSRTSDASLELIVADSEGVENHVSLDNAEEIGVQKRMQEELDQTLNQLDAMTRSEEALLEALRSEIEVTQEASSTPITNNPTIVNNDSGAVEKKHSADDHDSNMPSTTRSQDIVLDAQTPTNAIVDAEKQQEIAEAQYLEAIIKKIRFEFESLRTQINQESDRHTELHHKHETLKMSKASRLRSYREARAKIPVLQDKVRHLTQFIFEDLRLVYEREKEKSVLLIEKVKDMVAQRSARIKSLRKKQDILKSRITSTTSKAAATQGTLSKYRVEHYDIECSISEISDECDRLEASLVVKRKQKKEALENRIKREAMEREAELALLYEAWERRKAFQPEGDEIEELDIIDFSTKNLKRVPRLLASEAPSAKYANFDHNAIEGLYGLDRLTELISLSMNNNKITTFDATAFSKLKNLSLANNKLQAIAGLNDQIFYLDLSENPMITWDGLSSASSLQILMMRSTRASDLSFLQFMKRLLYLDLSENRLTEQVVDSFFSSPLLQYFNGSDNLFREFPDFSNSLLYEINLSSNLIARLSSHSWLLMLRVLNLSNNPIDDVQPLGTMPFLRELYLEKAKIKDIKMIYALCVSQFLEILDLSENPVVFEDNYQRIVGTLFPNLKTSDKKPVIRNPKSLSSRIWLHVQPLKVVHIIQPAIEQLSYFIRDSTTSIQDHLEMLADIQFFSETKEKGIITFFGQYKAPYLRYITKANGINSNDGLTRVIMQERKLAWLHTHLSEAENDIQNITRPSLDTMTAIRISQLLEEVFEQKVTLIQALWRGRIQKRRFLELKSSTCRLQVLVRNWLQCKQARALLSELREIKKLYAATNIQKLVRGLLARRRAQKLKERKKKEEEEARRVAEIAAQLTKEVESLPIDEDLDAFLNKDIDKEFDNKMRNYLSTEKLEHFTSNDSSIKLDDEDLIDDNIPNGKDINFGGVNAIYYKLNKFKIPFPETLSSNRHKLLTELRHEYSDLAERTQHVALRSSSPAGILVERTRTARKPRISISHTKAPRQREPSILKHDPASSSWMEPDDQMLQARGKSPFTNEPRHQHGHHDPLQDQTIAEMETGYHPGLTTNVEGRHSRHHSTNERAHDRNHRLHSILGNKNGTHANHPTTTITEMRGEPPYKTQNTGIRQESSKHHAPAVTPAQNLVPKLQKSRPLKPLDVVYEWDIHPGETLKKLVPQTSTKPNEKYQIGITGPGASTLAPQKESKFPQVIPLINNYVRRGTTPPVIPPVPMNIHSWTKSHDPSLISIQHSDVPFRTLAKPSLFPSDLDTIPTNLTPRAPIKSYEFSPHRPLPAITPPPIHFESVTHPADRSSDAHHISSSISVFSKLHR